MLLVILPMLEEGLIVSLLCWEYLFIAYLIEPSLSEYNLLGREVG